MKKLSQSIPILLLAVLAPVFLASCGKDNFDKIPKTGFVQTYKHNTKGRTPFLSYWEHGDVSEWNDRVAGKHGEKQLLYVKDINISHLQTNPDTAEKQKDLNELRGYFKKSLLTHLKKAEKTNPHFALVDKPSEKAYTLEIAITSIAPTNIKANVVGMGLGALQSGSDIITKKLARKHGEISIEGKLWDDKGKLVAEMADYEEDHPSVLGLDFKNFKKYAHHKQNIDIWSKQIAEIFTTSSDNKIKERKFFLNPF